MTLAQPVFNMNGTKLLEKDMVLSDKLIRSLQNAGAKRLWVTDDSRSFLKEYGPQKIFDEAVRELSGIQVQITEGYLLWAQAGSKLDRQLTSTFLRNVVAFPLRSTVKLSNGDVGKVVYQNSSFPTRPIVSVEGEMIDLSETTTLFVS